jgi:tetratricopeptide (TPR) repeat protein
MSKNKHNPEQPEDAGQSKQPEKPPSNPFLNLELPPDAAESVEEVLDIVEEDIPTVSPSEMPSEDDILEILAAQELDGSSSGKSGVKAVEIVDEGVDTEQKAHGQKTTPVQQARPTEHTIDVLEEILDAEEASNPKVEVKSGPTHTGARGEIVTELDLSEDELEAIDVSGAMPSSTGLPSGIAEAGTLAEQPSPTAPAPNFDKTTAFNANDDQTQEVAGLDESIPGEVVVDYEEMLGEGESAIDLGKRSVPKGERPSGVDLIAEALESGIDLEHHEPQAPVRDKIALSDSDIDLESVLEEGKESSSSVSLGGPSQGKNRGYHPAAHDEQAEDEGHVEFVGTTDEKLEGAGPDSAVEIHEAALLKHAASDEDEILVTPKRPVVIAGEPEVEEFAAAAIEEEPALEPEPMRAVAQPPEPLVTAPPKQKAKAPARELVGAGAGQRGGSLMPFLLGALLAALVIGGGGAAAWFLDMLPTSPNAVAKSMPKANVPSPDGNAKSVVEIIAAPVLAAQARDLIDDGKFGEALELLKEPKSGAEQAMHALASLKQLEAANKAVKLDDPAVQIALKALEDGGAKTIAADIRARLKAADDLAAFLADSGKVGDRVKVLEEEKIKALAELKSVKEEMQTAQTKFVQIKAVLDDFGIAADGSKLKATLKSLAGEIDQKSKDLAATEAKLTQINDALVKAGIKGDVGKEIANLTATAAKATKETESLNATVDAALAALKEANLLPKEGDRSTQLVDGIKKAKAGGESSLGAAVSTMVGPLAALSKAPPELFKKVFDTTRLSSELAALKAAALLAETPDRRLDGLVATLSDRSMIDPKELADAKRVVDLVNAPTSKVGPEARAKALLAEGLIYRNQENYAAAVQALQDAQKMATKAKTPAYTQKQIDRELKALTDPKAFYLPDADRRVAEGDTKAAMAALDGGLKVMPGNPELLLRRAQLTWESSRSGGGVPEKIASGIRADAEAARKDAKLAAESFYIVGLLEENAGHWAKAEADFRQAVALSGPGMAGERYRAALARILQRSPAAPAGTSPVGVQQQRRDSRQEVAFIDANGEAPAQGDGDRTSRKRLEESINLAKDLVQSSNPKTQGEGYMLMGAAQARLGMSNEGLKNFIKGLKLYYPNWPTEELEKMVAEHPAFRQIDVAVVVANPLQADRHFGKGLDYFWSRRYALAEGEFRAAVSMFNQDARFFYYLGLSRLAQGSAEKEKLAGHDFEQGARLEAARLPTMAVVNSSLERVQGEWRRVLNKYREGTLSPN